MLEREPLLLCLLSSFLTFSFLGKVFPSHHLRQSPVLEVCDSHSILSHSCDHAGWMRMSK